MPNEKNNEILNRFHIRKWMCHSLSQESTLECGPLCVKCATYQKQAPLSLNPLNI